MNFLLKTNPSPSLAQLETLEPVDLVGWFLFLVLTAPSDEKAKQAAAYCEEVARMHNLTPKQSEEAKAIAIALDYSNEIGRFDEGAEKKWLSSYRDALDDGHSQQDAEEWAFDAVYNH
tara:strand:+ start:65 stop:418 length:354 start_codon:yes stop_codon:yes gene_type:complete